MIQRRSAVTFPIRCSKRMRMNNSIIGGDECRNSVPNYNFSFLMIFIAKARYRTTGAWKGQATRSYLPPSVRHLNIFYSSIRVTFECKFYITAQFVLVFKPNIRHLSTQQVYVPITRPLPNKMDKMIGHHESKLFPTLRIYNKLIAQAIHKVWHIW